MGAFTNEEALVPGCEGSFFLNTKGQGKLSLHMVPCSECANLAGAEPDHRYGRTTSMRKASSGESTNEQSGKRGRIG